MDLVSVVTVLAVAAFPVVFVLVLLYLLRKGRISATTTLGAMYEVAPRSQQEAIEILVEKKANKKMEEEDESGAPDDPTQERFHEAENGHPQADEPEETEATDGDRERSGATGQEASS
jgi:hypothetical protein